MPRTVASRLDALALALLAIMPLGMALINRSAQPLLIGAAIATVAARASAGELGQLRDELIRLVRSPVGLAFVAFLLWALVSIAWSHHPRVSLKAYGELLGATLPALLVHAGLPRPLPAWFGKVAAIGLAIGCLTTVAELATGMALRAELGGRPDFYIFKRSVTAILTLLWPVAALVWLSGRRSVAVALVLLFGIATVAAQSSGALVGLAVGLAALGLAAALPRAVGPAVAAAVAVALLVAPFVGDLTARALSSHLVERLQFAHASDRIAIWQSFGEVVKRRPLTGAGFGTSPVMDQEPVAAEVPDDRRVLLGAWHPHNGYLQLWAETGGPGVLFAGLGLCLAAFGLSRLPGPQRLPGAAVFASALAVMTVGHGLWQGWWGAVLGTAALLCARVAPEPSNPTAPRTRPRP